MIFRASINDMDVLLDDEITDSRPTPECAADYLHRCVEQVVALYSSLPDAEPAAHTASEDDD